MARIVYHRDDLLIRVNRQVKAGHGPSGIRETQDAIKCGTKQAGAVGDGKR